MKLSAAPESSEILSGVLGLAGRCSTSTWISSVSSGLARRRGLFELPFLLRGLLLCSLLQLLPPLLSPGSLRSTRSRAVDRTAGGQTDRDRRTDRQRHTDRDTQKWRQTETQTDRQRERERENSEVQPHAENRF